MNRALVEILQLALHLVFQNSTYACTLVYSTFFQIDFEAVMLVNQWYLMNEPQAMADSEISYSYARIRYIILMPVYF